MKIFNKIKMCAIAGRIAVLLFCAPLLLCGCDLSNRETRHDLSQKKPLSVMTWNVHNLFDGNEEGTEYPEYRESSGWSREKYSGRLNVITGAIGTLQPLPDLIAFQEIENVGILQDFCASLKEYKWAYFANNSDAALGLGVISRYPLLETKVHSIYINGSVIPRPVLETGIETSGTVITFFVCHWKSKLGGEDSTEELRRAAARIILRRIRELTECSYGQEQPVIILGDLNENYDGFYRRGRKIVTALLPDEQLSAELAGFSQKDFFIISGNKPPAASFFPDKTVVFYSPWIEELKNGSYYYRDNWETIDHFLLSDQFFTGSGWEYENCVVIDRPPFANTTGLPVSYNARTGTGISDHLPLLVTLKFKE